MTVKEAINQVKDVDYYILRRTMEYVLNIKSNEYIIKQDQEISDEQLSIFSNFVDDLRNGKPVQYITHLQEFFGNDFYVDENVLIPQPDTEVVVEEVLKIVSKSNKKKLKILDLCTGSGVIAISIKQTFKNKVDVVASDISKSAIKVAKRNAKTILGKENSIEFIESDMFENIRGKFDVVVSNPPYIETETIRKLSTEVQNEPIIALDGGEDGLKFYRIIYQKIKKYLEVDGFLVMEIGYNQKLQILRMFENVRCIKDYCNNDRVIIWKNVVR